MKKYESMIIGLVLLTFVLVLDMQHIIVFIADKG